MQSHHCLPCLPQTWGTCDFLPLCTCLLCIQQLLLSTWSPPLRLSTHLSSFVGFSLILLLVSHLLPAGPSFLAFFGFLGAPTTATLAKALLMLNQAEGRYKAFSPLSQFVQCGVCLFHGTSDSCLACDP